jgi:hypothetical protein
MHGDQAKLYCKNPSHRKLVVGGQGQKLVRVPAKGEQRGAVTLHPQAEERKPAPGNVDDLDARLLARAKRGT